jgi:hypothetical protein
MTEEECKRTLDQLNDRQIRVMRGFAKFNMPDANATDDDIITLEKLGLIERNPPLRGMRAGVGYRASDEGRDCFDWYEKNY